MSNTPYPTHARTLTVNRDNWTGEEVTLNIREGNEFDYYDFTFYFEDTTEEDQGENKPGDEYYFRQLTVWDKNKSWREHPIFKVCKFDGDKYWAVLHMGIHREHPDPVVAAFQMLSNVL